MRKILAQNNIFCLLSRLVGFRFTTLIVKSHDQKQSYDNNVMFSWNNFYDYGCKSIG